MNILCLEEGFLPELTSGRLPYEFARELVQRGHTVTVVTIFPRKLWVKQQLTIPKAKLFYWDQMGKVLILRCWPQFKGKSIVTRTLEYLIIPLSLLSGGLIAGRKEVIHCQSPPLLLAFTACILKMLTRATFILRIQDIHPDALVKIGLIKNKLLIKALEVLEKFVYCCAGHITVIADGYRRNILLKGVNPEKVSLIPNWADIQRIESTQKTDEPSINNSLTNKFVVTYAGTMSWPQDLETVIEAAHLLNEYKDILFLIVGEGVKKEPLMKRSEKLKLKNVVFMPLQPRDVYFKILQASDACFVPLRKNYNSPTAPSKMLEIMACSKPIIANVPYDSDVHKIISEAGCGLWVEPENPESLSQAVLKLYENRDLVRQLGGKGREFVENHLSLTVCMDKYEALINSLLAKKVRS